MDDPVAHALGFVRNFAPLAERLATRKHRGTESTLRLVCLRFLDSRRVQG
jgi:hypothetical protein